jgi:hypothetical protein
MCNLYSITTNQAAIIALFRVVNRYVGNLAPMPSCAGPTRRTARRQHDHDARASRIRTSRPRANIPRPARSGSRPHLFRTSRPKGVLGNTH